MDKTSALEALRVDRVKPLLAWAPCVDTETIDYAERAQCAIAQLPLDYDRPNGQSIPVALLKMPALEPSRRIGALFVNPGGPGGSGVSLANIADLFLGSRLLNRFDIIGFDPRGVGASQQVRCFKTLAELEAAVANRPFGFPTNADELVGQRQSARALATGCSTTGRPLSAAMSTAEVARDMEVLRRTVKGGKLNFLGFSYGSYLGQVYANMFPDRVRSVVIDGVLDPEAWAGTRATANQVLDDRLQTAVGTVAGFDELLKRCAAAGSPRCSLAERGDPREAFELLVTRLKQNPIVFEDPVLGEVVYTYPMLIGDIVSFLYLSDGTEVATTVIAGLLTLSDPAATAADQAAAAASVRQLRKAAQAALAEDDYANGFDAFLSVMCTDGVHPQAFQRWVTSAEAADQRVPHFGRFWNWSSSECARNFWKASDEDGYFGPFNRTTVKPVLVVGNYYDPATPYLGAQAADMLLPNSRLISSDSFGHTAYGTSSCLTNAVDRFFLREVPPPQGTVCTGDYQPYADASAPTARELAKQLTGPIGGGRPPR